MQFRTAPGLSALMLGTALATVPAMAQTGNTVSGTAQQQQYKYPIGRSVNEGGSNYGPQENHSASSERTGARESREARSASGGERINGERTNSTRMSSNRERLSSERMRVGERERIGGTRVSERERTSGERVGVSEHERVSVGERERLGGERFAGREGGGETFGFGEQRRYYDYAPGLEVAGGARGGIGWCEMRFRSFDPVTGTYMGFDGLRHPCP